MLAGQFAPLLNWLCFVLHVFLTDVSDYYVLVADGLFILFFLLFLFPLLLTSVIILIFFYSFVIFCTVYLE